MRERSKLSGDKPLVHTPSEEGRCQTAHVWRVLALGLPFTIYLALSVIFFDHARSWTRSFLGGAGDPLPCIWFLNWWPFAIAHHLNPFISNYVWYPKGFNFSWATAVPLAALLGTPLTLLGGPVLTYNFWSIMAPRFRPGPRFFWHGI
jgi:hypothetical protein